MQVPERDVPRFVSNKLVLVFEIQMIKGEKPLRAADMPIVTVSLVQYNVKFTPDPSGEPPSGLIPFSFL